MVASETSRLVNLIYQNIDNFFERSDNYIRPFEKTSFDVPDVIDSFYKTRAILTELKILPIEILPPSILMNIVVIITELRSALEELGNFLLKGLEYPEYFVDYKSEGESFHNIVNQKFTSLFNAISPHLPFLQLKRGDIDKVFDRLKDQQKEADEFLLTIKSAQKEIASILDAAHDIAAEAGVSHFTCHFSDEADSYRKGAFRWLVATSILAFTTLASTIFLAVAPFYFQVKYPSYFQLMNENIALLITSKLTIIIVLLTATLWCAKVYKSSLHLFVINKHRANALITFQAFVKASDDSQTKNAVLLEASHCIFSASGTGLTDTNETSDQIKFLEVFKGVNNQH